MNLMVPLMNPDIFSLAAKTLAALLLPDPYPHILQGDSTKAGSATEKLWWRLIFLKCLMRSITPYSFEDNESTTLRPCLKSRAANYTYARQFYVKIRNKKSMIQTGSSLMGGVISGTV